MIFEGCQLSYIAFILYYMYTFIHMYISTYICWLCINNQQNRRERRNDCNEKVLSLFTQCDYRPGIFEVDRLWYQCISISMSPCIGHNNIRRNKSHCLPAKYASSVRGRKRGNNDQPSRFRFQPWGSEVYIRSTILHVDRIRGISCE